MAAHQEGEDTEAQLRESYQVAVPIANPPERAPTSLTLKAFTQICAQFGLIQNEVLLPGPIDTVDRPPHGYVAVNRQMCLSGVIPPFNDFLRVFLLRLTISPFQLHPNGYAILMGLCVLFRRTLDRLPSFGEICYLCSFTKIKDHPSIIVIRSARNRKLITDLPESAHGFFNQYFFVRCPPGFYAIWRVGTLPLPSKDPIFKQTFERLNVVPKDERSIKFLLKEEFLHQYGLLHTSRSIQSREALTEVPDSPAKASDAPAAVEHLSSKELITEVSLAKCSTPKDDAGPSKKPVLAPIIEEDEPSHHTEEIGEKEREGGNFAGRGNEDIFEDLSDIWITSQELFKDSPVVTKAVSPAIEATSTLKQIPQESPLTLTPTTTPQTRSDSSMKRGNAYYDDFKRYGRRSQYDYSYHLPSYRETEEERAIRKDRERRVHEERYGRDERHDSSHRDDDSHKRKAYDDKGKGHDAGDSSKRARPSEQPGLVIPEKPTTQTSHSPAPTHTDIQSIIGRPSYSVGPGPATLQSRFPSWCLKGVRFDLDLVPIDKNAMFRNLEAVKTDIERMSNWQKLVDELQRLNRANLEAMLTMENDKTEWQKVLKQHDAEMSSIAAYNEKLEAEMKKLKADLIASSTSYSQKEGLLQQQVRDAHAAQRIAEDKADGLERIVESCRIDVAQLREQTSSQTAEIEKLKAQLSIAEKERDAAIAGRIAAEESHEATKADIGSTLFDFYLQCVLGRGSLSFLGPKYEVTLAEVWEVALDMLKSAGYPEDELEAYYLDESARAALARGKEQLSKARAGMTGEEQPEKEKTLPTSAPPSTSVDVDIAGSSFHTPPATKIITETTSAQGGDEGEESNEAQRYEISIREPTAPEKAPSQTKASPPPVITSPPLQVTPTSQPGSHEEIIGALQGLDNPVASQEQKDEGVKGGETSPERTPSDDVTLAKLVTPGSESSSRRRRKRATSKKRKYSSK